MAENVKTSKFRGIHKGLIRFFKEEKSELKKVIWPSRQQLINNTITVLGACLVIGAIIWIVDAGLAEVTRQLFTKK